jgi:hypothetical protein
VNKIISYYYGFIYRITQSFLFKLFKEEMRIYLSNQKLLTIISHISNSGENSSQKDAPKNKKEPRKKKQRTGGEGYNRKTPRRNQPHKKPNNSGGYGPPLYLFTKDRVLNFKIYRVTIDVFNVYPDPELMKSMLYRSIHAPHYYIESIATQGH